MNMKLISVAVLILVLITACGKRSDKITSKKSTTNVHKSITSKSLPESKSSSLSETPPSTTEQASSSIETSTTSDASTSVGGVIGEKQPVVTSEVPSLPTEFFGKWVNHVNGDYFEISKLQFVSGSDVGATSSDIVKVGRDHEGYLVQTSNGLSYFLTIKSNKLYPTTSQVDLTSDFLAQITFDKK